MCITSFGDFLGQKEERVRSFASFHLASRDTVIDNILNYNSKRAE